MTVRIRAVGPDDWADWRLMRHRSLTEDRDAFSSSTAMWTGDRDTEANWRTRLGAPGACFVAYEGAVPVGMVGAQPVEDGGVALISMWVAGEARGHGTGGRLIDAVIAWSGDRPLSLRVMDGNGAAVRAYESRGFVLESACADGEGCLSMTRPGTHGP